MSGQKVNFLLLFPVVAIFFLFRFNFFKRSFFQKNISDILKRFRVSLTIIFPCYVTESENLDANPGNYNL